MDKILCKYGLKYDPRKKQVSEISDEYKQEEDKKKLLNTLYRALNFYKLIGDKSRKQVVEKIIKYIQNEEVIQPVVVDDSTIDAAQNNQVLEEGEVVVEGEEEKLEELENQSTKRTPSRLHKNGDLPPTCPRIDTTNCDRRNSMSSSKSSVVSNKRKSLTKCGSRRSTLSSGRRRSITPAKVVRSPLDESYHLCCRFYAGTDEFNDLRMNDYLEMNRGKLIRKVMRDLHFFFPLLGEVICDVEFKETDKNIMSTTQEIRYNFNRFIDSLLVGLGVRQIGDDNSLKWVTDEVYPCYELKKIVLRMRDCIMQLFGTWIIYIENLNEIINNFNITVDDVVSPRENDEDDENMNEMIDLRTTIVMRRNSVYYERLHPILSFYSGHESEDKYLLDYFKLKKNDLIQEILFDKHFFYPLLDDKKIVPEFTENEVEVMREEQIIRQHFNELLDDVLCELNVRQKIVGSDRKSYHYIWSYGDYSKLKNEEKGLIKRIKKCLELIYPKWKIYIEVLEKAIESFGTYESPESSVVDEELEEDRERENGDEGDYDEDEEIGLEELNNNNNNSNAEKEPEYEEYYSDSDYSEEGIIESEGIVEDSNNPEIMKLNNKLKSKEKEIHKLKEENNKLKESKQEVEEQLEEIRKELEEREKNENQMNEDESDENSDSENDEELKKKEEELNAIKSKLEEKERFLKEKENEINKIKQEIEVMNESEDDSLEEEEEICEEDQMIYHCDILGMSKVYIYIIIILFNFINR